MHILLGITAINNFNLIAEFLELTSSKIAKLTADWIRVGYCQGNFNSDNCLVAGRTMDYGPFGYAQKFEPYWNMWLVWRATFWILKPTVSRGKLS